MRLHLKRINKNFVDDWHKHVFEDDDHYYFVCSKNLIKTGKTYEVDLSKAKDLADYPNGMKVRGHYFEIEDITKIAKEVNYVNLHSKCTIVYRDRKYRNQDILNVFGSIRFHEDDMAKLNESGISVGRSIKNEDCLVYIQGIEQEYGITDKSTYGSLIALYYGVKKEDIIGLRGESE